MKALPPETWQRFNVDELVDVPLWPRDEWGRDKVDVELLGSENTADLWVGVPIELVNRVRYDDEVFVLMVTSPQPMYWREA